MADLDVMADLDAELKPVQKSTAELAGDLSRELAALVHQEISLAKVELAEKGKRAGIGAGSLGFAGVLGLFGLGTLTAAIVSAIDHTLPLWLSALIVAIAYFAAGGFMAFVGKKEIQQAVPPVPEQALESTKEDVEWLKSQARFAKR